MRVYPADLYVGLRCETTFVQRGTPLMIDDEAPVVAVGVQRTDQGNPASRSHGLKEGIKNRYIFLIGLKKRMIITSGFNVYPKEIEDVLSMHPAVRKVEVVGKKDLMRGEVVLARIVLKEGAAVDDKEILRYCRTYLSSYKVPREVEFVDALPKSGSGKVMWRLLQEQEATRGSAA